jgi:hypothetical protein
MLRAIVSAGSRGLKIMLSAFESIGNLPFIASNLLIIHGFALPHFSTRAIE